MRRLPTPIDERRRRGGPPCSSCASGVLVSALLALGLHGCSQHYEEGTHPPPRPPASARLPAEHPPLSAPKVTPEKRRQSESGSVSGRIRVSAALQGRIPKGAYLFILARERSQGGPPPYAVKRIRVPRFPYEYSLGQSDVLPMAGEGIVFEEIPEMYLIAKIDQDGRVGLEPGDMEGECLDNPVAAGQHGRDILIDRLF